MAEFVIKLADERGRVQEQVQTAASAEELRLRFAHAGYHVFEVKARSTVSVLGRRKVKLERFLIFNQQFLTLIRAGLPILGSLNMLAKGQKDAHFAGQLDDVANRVKTGESLSAAFEAQAGIPTIYTTTLLAGERSGNLQEVLERYVAFQRVSLTFRKKLTASLIYPCLLLTLVSGFDGFPVHGGDSAVLKALRRNGIAAACNDDGPAGVRHMVAAQHCVDRTGRADRRRGGIPVFDHGQGTRRGGWIPDRATGVWEDLAEVPGGAVSRGRCRRC